MALKLLKKAIIRNEPTRFSFVHHRFLQLCLSTRCFRDALVVLDIELFDFPLSKAKDLDPASRGFEVTYQDVLEYYLFGGIVYMGMKNWRRAVDHLTYVVTAPGSGCSAIQVEAYKKYILASLLLNGKV